MIRREVHLYRRKETKNDYLLLLNSKIQTKESSCKQEEVQRVQIVMSAVGKRNGWSGSSESISNGSTLSEEYGDRSHNETKSEASCHLCRGISGSVLRSFTGKGCASGSVAGSHDGGLVFNYSKVPQTSGF
jgi:hypothetical protein